MADEHDETTPPAGRLQSAHDLSTARAGRNGGPPRMPGPELTTAEYQLFLATKIEIQSEAIINLEAASKASGDKAHAAERAAKRAEDSVSALGEIVEHLATSLNGSLEGIKRAFDEQSKRIEAKHSEITIALAPIVKERTEWSGAKAVAARIGLVLGAFGAVGGAVLSVAKVAEHFHWFGL